MTWYRSGSKAFGRGRNILTTSNTSRDAEEMISQPPQPFRSDVTKDTPVVRPETWGDGYTIAGDVNPKTRNLGSKPNRNLAAVGYSNDYEPTNQNEQLRNGFQTRSKRVAGEINLPGRDAVNKETGSYYQPTGNNLKLARQRYPGLMKRYTAN